MNGSNQPVAVLDGSYEAGVTYGLQAASLNALVAARAAYRMFKQLSSLDLGRLELMGKVKAAARLSTLYRRAAREYWRDVLEKRRGREAGELVGAELHGTWPDCFWQRDLLGGFVRVHHKESRWLWFAGDLNRKRASLSPAAYSDPARAMESGLAALERVVRGEQPVADWEGAREGLVSVIDWDPEDLIVGT